MIDRHSRPVDIVNVHVANPLIRVPPYHDKRDAVIQQSLDQRIVHPRRGHHHAVQVTAANDAPVHLLRSCRAVKEREHELVALRIAGLGDSGQKIEKEMDQ